MTPKRTAALAIVAPSDSAAAPSLAPRVLHVVLGRWAFCGCWWLVMGFHTFLGAFALSAAALHWYLQTGIAAMAMNSMNMPKKTLELTAQVFFLVGFLHFTVIVRVLYRSFRARRHVLHAPKVVKKDRSGIGLVHRSWQAYDAASVAWSSLFGPTGFFGFSNPHFETLFLVREGWEILLQTYQAYKLSESVPRKWINQLAVAVIVLNCVSSPLVHLVFRKREGSRRVLNPLQDAVLDFSCSIVIPLSIFLPYARIYNPTTGMPSELLMDDVWFVNAIAETRQVLVTSFPDFVATVIPQLSQFGYLLTFKNLLRRRSVGVHDQQTHTTAGQDRPVEKDQSLRQSSPTLPWGPVLQNDISIVSTDSQRPQQSRRNPAKLRRLVGIVTHVVFVLWGGGVLGLHLEAYRNTDRHIPGCQLHASAWHSPRYPCSVMQLNCHVAKIDGSEKALTPIFDKLGRSSLRVLILSHCPQLTMPAIVTEFDQLTGIEVFNSTLVAWPAEAALHEATQPLVGYIFFVLTNWTSFPTGLLHDQLPTAFMHFTISASNLTLLPDAIGVWSSQEWFDIVLERVPFLTKLPDSFCSLHPMALSVAGSGLTILPMQCTTHERLTILGLSGSALRSLPDAVGPSVIALFAEDIQVAQLPDSVDHWYHTAPSKAVAFHGSALCDSTAIHEDMSVWDETCRSALATAQVTYPMDVMMSLRPFDGVHVSTSSR